jgi:hypothetical protein
VWGEVVADPESLAIADQQLAELDRRYAQYPSLIRFRVVPFVRRQSSASIGPQKMQTVLLLAADQELQAAYEWGPGLLSSQRRGRKSW